MENKSVPGSDGPKVPCRSVSPKTQGYQRALLVPIDTLRPRSGVSHRAIEKFEFVKNLGVKGFPIRVPPVWPLQLTTMQAYLPAHPSPEYDCPSPVRGDPYPDGLVLLSDCVVHTAKLSEPIRAVPQFEDYMDEESSDHVVPQLSESVEELSDEQGEQEPAPFEELSDEQEPEPFEELSDEEPLPTDVPEMLLGRKVTLLDWKEAQAARKQLCEPGRVLFCPVREDGDHYNQILTDCINADCCFNPTGLYPSAVRTVPWNDIPINQLSRSPTCTTSAVFKWQGRTWARAFRHWLPHLDFNTVTFTKSDNYWPLPVGLVLKGVPSYLDARVSLPPICVWDGAIVVCVSALVAVQPPPVWPTNAEELARADLDLLRIKCHSCGYLSIGEYFMTNASLNYCGRCYQKQPGSSHRVPIDVELDE